MGDMEDPSPVTNLSSISFGTPEVRRGFTDEDDLRVDNIARTWYSDPSGSVELGFRTLPDGRKEVVFKGDGWDVDGVSVGPLEAVFALPPPIADFSMNTVAFKTKTNDMVMLQKMN